MARVKRLIMALLALVVSLACARTADADLQSAALVRLRMDPPTARFPIAVAVTRGVARLTGETDTRAQQQRAADIVKSVDGVTNVTNDLRLSDRAITVAIERAFSAEPMLAGIDIAVTVYRGVVRLESADTDKFQRARAVGITAHIDGVVRVDDHMR